MTTAPGKALDAGRAFGRAAAPRLRRALRLVADAVLPPQCPGCDALVDEPASLCARCWARVRFVGAPVCAACGAPFSHDLGPGALCASCVRAPPPFARARSALLYDDASRALVLRFKHADRTELAPLFGKWMVAAGRDLASDADWLVPVPMHWTRLAARHYNQAALLALALGRATGRPALPDALARRRRTPRLGHLSGAARRRALQGAIAVWPAAADRIADRRVLLIDDVLTTMATAEACARALLRAGARAVDVLTLARTARSEG